MDESASQPEALPSPEACAGIPGSGTRPDAAMPPIYSPVFAAGRSSWTGRGLALAMAAVCAWVLITAARVTPSHTGVGTHEDLGFATCGWLMRTGVPCLTCGMTTSFAHFVRGQVLASIYVQPMGAVLAILTCVCFWIGLYVAVTGRAVYNLLRFLPTTRLLFLLLGFALLAWGWKIFLRIKGIDGWGEI